MIGSDRGGTERLGCIGLKPRSNAEMRGADRFDAALPYKQGVTGSSPVPPIVRKRGSHATSAVAAFGWRDERGGEIDRQPLRVPPDQGRLTDR